MSCEYPENGFHIPSCLLHDNISSIQSSRRVKILESIKGLASAMDCSQKNTPQTIRRILIVKERRVSERGGKKRRRLCRDGEISDCSLFWQCGANLCMSNMNKVAECVLKPSETCVRISSLVLCLKQPSSYFLVFFFFNVVIYFIFGN